MAADDLERIGNNATSVITNVFDDIKNALKLSPYEINTDNIKYARVSLLILIVFVLNIFSYCLSLVAKRKLITFFMTVILPVIPLFSCFIIVLYGYISSLVYKEFLGNDMLVSFYASILGSVFTPIAIFFGCSFSFLYRTSFVVTALLSDYLIRSMLVKNRDFPSSFQKFQFIALSVLMNILFYVFIFPLFFC